MFDDDCDDECPAAPMTIWDLVIAFFAFLTGVAQAFEHSCEYMLKASAMANNHGVMKKNFENEARDAIEQITSGGTDA